MTCIKCHLLKSIWKWNIYLGPLDTMLRILDSEMILQFPVTTWPAAGSLGLRFIHSYNAAFKFAHGPKIKLVADVIRTTPASNKAGTI